MLERWARLHHLALTPPNSVTISDHAGFWLILVRPIVGADGVLTGEYEYVKKSDLMEFTPPGGIVSGEGGQRRQ